MRSLVVVLHRHVSAACRHHLASLAGASLRELMDRMGHSTTRAALIYLHRTSERDRAIADGMGELAKTGLKPARPSGTQRARKPGKPRRSGA